MNRVNEEEFQQFVAGVKRIKKEKGAVYLVIGDCGPYRSEEEIKQGIIPKTRAEARFGDDRFVFMDTGWRKHLVGKRVGINADVNDLTFWERLSSELKGYFKLVLDDNHLIAKSWEESRLPITTEEAGKSSRKAVMDEIYKLLESKGQLILTQPFGDISELDKKDVFDKFEIWRTSNTFACYPGGRGQFYGQVFNNNHLAVIRNVKNSEELSAKLSDRQRKIIKMASLIYSDILRGGKGGNELTARLNIARKKFGVGGDAPIYLEEDEERGIAQLSMLPEVNGKKLKEASEGMGDICKIIEQEIIPIIYPWKLSNTLKDAKLCEAEEIDPGEVMMDYILIKKDKGQ